jgi:probable F420-dependent oxidoreductase
MLRLAAERASGAHPYFVPVEHTRQAAKYSDLVDCWRWCRRWCSKWIQRAHAQSRARTREQLLSLENYANNLRRFGWDSADLAPESGGSDPLVDAVVAWGDAAAIQHRVQAHLEAGADHVCIQALAPTSDPEEVLESLWQLAPVLNEALARGHTGAAAEDLSSLRRGSSPGQSGSLRPVLLGWLG